MTNHLLRFLLLLSLPLLAISCTASEPTNQVCFKNKCFNVEVAQTNEELSRGLQHRTSLGDNEGMLFIFPSSRRHSFWMKDTLIPLDIIWLDHARRVVHIESNVPPCKAEPCPTYAPPEAALYVLEINADLRASLNITTGLVAEFEID